MFLARRLNSGIPYQAAPSGGNMSIKKTLGLICLCDRASRIDNGFVFARAMLVNAARSWLAQKMERILTDGFERSLRM